MNGVLDYKSRNENLVERTVLKNDLELIITKSVMHQGPTNTPLHNEIICQINRKAEIVKLDLNFLEAPKPSRDNYVNVTQNSPEWFSVRKYKVTGSCLPSLIGLSGEPKFDLIWEVVKKGKSDPDMTFIKNISREHYYDWEAITNFEKKFRIVKLKSVDFFSILLTLDMAVAQMSLDLWEFY